MIKLFAIPSESSCTQCTHRATEIWLACEYKGRASLFCAYQPRERQRARLSGPDILSYSFLFVSLSFSPATPALCLVHARSLFSFSPMDMFHEDSNANPGVVGILITLQSIHGS